MRRIAHGLVVAGLALAMASPVLAQQGKGQRKGQGQGQGKAQGKGFGGFGGGFGQGGMMGGGGGALQLLANSGVQKELKLTDEQATKVTAAVTEQREKNRERMQSLGQDASPEARREVMSQVQASAVKAAEAILNPDQMKRFDQIRIQNMNIAAFQDEKVVKALKINDDQKEKIRELQRESMEAMRGQFRPGGGGGAGGAGGGDFQAAMAKMQEARKATFTKALDVLTADQKTAWKELTGDPFEVKFEMPARRRID